MNEVLISLVTALFSGGLSSLAVLRFIRQKARAEAKLTETGVRTSELDNVQEAVKIWREMAESLHVELEKSRNDYKSVATEIELLRKEVARLSNINNKIVKALDKITPENLERMIEQIKKDIHENNA